MEKGWSHSDPCAPAARGAMGLLSIEGQGLRIRPTHEIVPSPQLGPGPIVKCIAAQ